MIAIKEQMIQTSPLDLKGYDCCALSFLIPAYAYPSGNVVTITPWGWLCRVRPLTFGKRFYFCECTQDAVYWALMVLSTNLFVSLCMEATLSCEVHDYTDCV